LWRRFDAAVEDLNRAATGTNLIDVADAYEKLAEAARLLAKSVEAEDRASGPARRACKRSA
jgi:hypothetical protein